MTLCWMLYMCNVSCPLKHVISFTNHTLSFKRLQSLGRGVWQELGKQSGWVPYGIASREEKSFYAGESTGIHSGNQGSPAFNTEYGRARQGENCLPRLARSSQDPSQTHWFLSFKDLSGQTWSMVRLMVFRLFLFVCPAVRQCGTSRDGSWGPPPHISTVVITGPPVKSGIDVLIQAFSGLN